MYWPISTAIPLSFRQCLSAPKGCNAPRHAPSASARQRRDRPRAGPALGRRAIPASASKTRHRHPRRARRAPRPGARQPATALAPGPARPRCAHRRRPVDVPHRARRRDAALARRARRHALPHPARRRGARHHHRGAGVSAYRREAGLRPGAWRQQRLRRRGCHRPCGGRRALVLPQSCGA